MRLKASSCLIIRGPNSRHSMALPDVDTSSNQDQLFIFVAFSFSTIIVALLYLFYSNRIFAALLSSILRIFQINLVVTSIQFAPISGRLLIRNLRLKTVDYTLSVVSVVIHYDFWSGKGSSAELSGVELFLYNRLSYYESLLASLNGQELREIKSQSWIVSFVPKTTRIKIASIIVGNNDIPDILVAEFKTCVLNGSTNASVSGFKLSIKPNVHYGSCATPRKNWFDILFGKPRPVPLRQWSGLARYHSAAEAEYAKVAQVLECDFKATLSAQLDLEVMECSAAYGPWTDRQRFAFFYFEGFDHEFLLSSNILFASNIIPCAGVQNQHQIHKQLYLQNSLSRRNRENQTIFVDRSKIW